METERAMWPDALAAIEDAIVIARRLLHELGPVNGTQESRELVGQLLHRLAAAKLQVAQQSNVLSA